MVDLYECTDSKQEAMLTLAELRSARIAKYDIALKHLFSLENNTFRRILGVPEGKLLQEEFPGLEFRRADALLYVDETIYHVEFQSKNDPKMPARMHEYAHLIDKYKGHYGIGKINRLFQKVVYVGPGSNTMESPYTRWGTTHEFESFAITSKFKDPLFNDLIKSRYPYDWIVALLLLPKDQFKHAHMTSAARDFHLPKPITPRACPRPDSAVINIAGGAA